MPTSCLLRFGLTQPCQGHDINNASKLIRILTLRGGHVILTLAQAVAHKLIVPKILFLLLKRCRSDAERFRTAFNGGIVR